MTPAPTTPAPTTPAPTTPAPTMRAPTTPAPPVCCKQAPTALVESQHLVRERRLLSASSASNIAPFDCSANSLPIQVKLNDAETAYDVLELNIETGATRREKSVPVC